MDAITGEILPYMLKSGSRFHESEKEIRIKREAEARIDASGLKVKIAPPERRRLLEVESTVKVTHFVDWRLTPVAKPRSLSIDPERIAVNKIRFVVHGARCGDQRTRQIGVVGIQIREDVPRRTLETLANGISSSLIFFTDPVRELWLVPADHLDTLIR